MNTEIFCFTGTGNSLWVARTLANRLRNTKVVPIRRTQSPIKVAADAVGIVFPVHIWGLPGRVIDFVQRLEPDDAKYYFAVAVNAGQVAATLLQLRKLLISRGIRLACGFEITLASNYIPWGGPGPEEKINYRISQAVIKIEKIAESITGQKNYPPEKGPWWHNILLSWFYKMSFPHIAAMDGKFWVDGHCHACGICVKICPNHNIQLQEHKPVWLHHCEQCLACLQWCPKSAIQYGSKTPQYHRYHHPEIKTQDILDIYQ